MRLGIPGNSEERLGEEGTAQESRETGLVDQVVRESEERLRTISDNLPGSFTYQNVTRPDGTVRYTYISAGVERLFGLSVQRVTADPAAFLGLLVEEDRPHVAATEEAALRDKAPFDCEFRWRTVAGEIKWVHCRSTAHRLADGSIVWNGVITDITARKQAADVQRQLEIQMQQAQKEESMGVLAGGIAHDFNNLLTVVICNLELVAGTMPAGSPARLALDKAARAAGHAADLCQQMLAYAGKTPLSSCPVQLNGLLQNMVHLINACLSGQAQLEWRLADLLPPVQADPGQVRQIIMNLLTNAIEAIGNQPGRITLTTGAARCTASELQSPWLPETLPTGNYVFLEVTDNGCGIDAATLTRIFEPFFSTKFTGRGLGLAAVLGIVRSHHGTVQVQSAPGHGSTFRVWLPAVNGEPNAAVPADAPAEHWRGSGTVLLVDDEEGIRSTAREMIAALGFETVTAKDGIEALEILQANPERFECVILDATMPRLSGEETFQQLVRIREDVRVVLSSGYAKQDILTRFTGHSLCGFLQKPYRLADLAAVLQRATETLT